MSIAFSCAACDAPLTVRDELAGRRLRCTNCGSSNMVPELDGAEASATTGQASFARTNAGVAAFYRILIVGGILIVALTVFTATLLIAGSAPVLPIEEVLVGGVKTTTGVIRRSDRIKEPRPVLGKVHKVTLKKDQSYVIDQESTELDSYLLLVDATGRIVAEDDDGGGNLNARIIYRPLDAGEYRIIATSFNRAQTGNYKLSIREDDGKAALVVQPRFPLQPAQEEPFFPQKPLPQARGGPISRRPATPAELVDGKFEVKDQIRFADKVTKVGLKFGKVYEMQLTAGVTYRIELEFDALGKGVTESPHITVQSVVNNPAVSQWKSNSGKMVEMSFTPTATGRYRIVASSNTGGFLGPYTLRVTEEK